MFAFYNKTPSYFPRSAAARGQFLTRLSPRAWRRISFFWLFRARFASPYSYLSLCAPLSLSAPLHILISPVAFSFFPHYYRAVYRRADSQGIQSPAGTVNPKARPGPHKNCEVSTAMTAGFSKLKLRLPERIDVINGHRGRNREP